ncbi:PepSY domain-containing protein [Paenibacillus typhae]|uniref:Peptidase propeptide and YPEB domain-containing protein n=1 Tax=Paenibacillus typhae TaxID=1174501 RepID=A0A1G9D2V2_9BACL|nr:PepSY domain-containing protein [Paenibacillus typhae]SDK58241.1 Peptidase propeptide and YPEB domain-containing protein [Paenibacillus typhae]
MSRPRIHLNIPYKTILIAAAVLLLAIACLWFFRKETGPLLSREAAEQALLEEYPGTIQQLSERAGNYAAKLQTAQGLYEVKLDGATGEIISIVLLQAVPAPGPTPEVQPSPDASGAPVVSASPPAGAASATPPAPSTSPPQRVVSEAEAVKLALQEVPGEADDVDTGINEDGAFYLVEISTPDDREAVVQVDAISGNIRSVTWEEPDDDHE